MQRVDRILEARTRYEARRARARRRLAADAPQELDRAFVLRDLARGGEAGLQQARLRRQCARVAQRRFAAMRERAQRRGHPPEGARLQLAHTVAPSVGGLLQLALVAVERAAGVAELRLGAVQLVGKRLARLCELRGELGMRGLEMRDTRGEMVAARPMARPHARVVELGEGRLLFGPVGTKPDSRRQLARLRGGAALQRREELLAVRVGGHRHSAGAAASSVAARCKRASSASFTAPAGASGATSMCAR